MKREFYCEKLDGRLNSFWYFGIGKIAKFTLGTNQILLREKDGIRVGFSIDSCYYKNSQSVDKALELNLFDVDLQKSDFGFCNYFDFAYKTASTDDWEEIDGDEEFDYDKAIEKMEIYLKDSDFWKQF